MLVSGCVTVTLQVALLPPQLAVMVAVPGAFAVIFPSETVTTLESLVFHVTVLFAASLGETVAVN